MLVDPTIVRAIEAPLPPEPPRMAEERVMHSELGAKAEKVAVRLASEYQGQADRWLGTLDGIVASYRLIEPGDADPVVLDELDDTIGLYEAVAERRAVERARFEKRSRRQVKARFRLDPSLGAVTRTLAGNLLATDDRIIQAMLDYALFLRAVRADRDPAKGPRPVFDNAEAMGAELRRRLPAS